MQNNMIKPQISYEDFEDRFLFLVILKAMYNSRITINKRALEIWAVLIKFMKSFGFMIVFDNGSREQKYYTEGGILCQ